MWTMIPSLEALVAALAPAFTQPSFATHCRFLLGWLMCLGPPTLWRVAETTQPQQPPDHSARHRFDGYYNFFERSAWTPSALAQRVAVLLLTRLTLTGRITLLVDDTLAHKRGQSVWGLGWFRDAVASTHKRVAVASGHNWVVVAVAYGVPGTSVILALPVLARLHRQGPGQPSCAMLARAMLAEVLQWFPTRRFTLVGDGAYACKELLATLDERVTFVGRLRGDAAVYDPQVPSRPKGRRGRPPGKGPRLPSPKAAAARADRAGPPSGPWRWQAVTVSAYGKERLLQTCAYTAVWPHVRGLRPVQIVVVRDPAGALQDAYLFTTDRTASVGWVIAEFARRWSVEVLFRASKQVLDVERPQHWCQASVEKVVPWVLSMQSVIELWYLTAGRASPEAAEMRRRMGAWDSEWSLRHMIQVMQRATLNATITPNSADASQLREMVQTLQNWALLAA